MMQEIVRNLWSGVQLLSEILMIVVYFGCIFLVVSAIASYIADEFRKITRKHEKRF